jgi:hypothetical protein
MATDKKSFVLYADLIHTVSKMPDDKAGQLLKHILSYVNDDNPVTEDLIIQLTFEPIKQQLKRDLEKYKNKKLQWSEAGKRSAELRKVKKNQRPSTTVEKRATLSTVNDSVSVNDNVTVNDNKETTKEIFKFYNLERKDLPEATKFTDSRKKLVKCRLKEYDQNTIKKVILKARDNNFLNGNETNFKSNFDWIFNKANFLKILEGNYENKNTNFGKEKPAFKLKTNRP